MTGSVSVLDGALRGVGNCYSHGRGLHSSELRERALFQRVDGGLPFSDWRFGFNPIRWGGGSSILCIGLARC